MYIYIYIYIYFFFFLCIHFNKIKKIKQKNAEINNESCASVFVFVSLIIKFSLSGSNFLGIEGWNCLRKLGFKQLLESPPNYEGQITKRLLGVLVKTG